MLLFLVTLPWWAYLFWGKGKYRRSWKQRLLRQTQEKVATIPGTVIWVHAVSLGETKAVGPLIRRFLQEAPELALVVSSGTETGHAEAKKAFPEARLHLMLPLDFPWLVDPLVQTLSPGLVVLVESDFWWNFLWSAKRRGATLAVVNGKMSATSFSRFRWVPCWSRALFSLFDFVCVQTEEFGDRFREVGVSPKRLHKTGNLKWDQEGVESSLEEQKAFAAHLGIAEGDVLVVAGSTHAGEEKALVEALRPALLTNPKLKLLLVPRHPERFEEVAALLEKQSLPYSRWSQKEPISSQSILVDAMGQLRRCYALASLAFVGGSLYPGVGGHNIMEPCGVGVPVLFGPHMASQREMVVLVVEAQAGEMVTEAHLRERLMHWIGDASLRKSASINGKALKVRLQGSTEATWQVLQPTIREMQKKNQKTGCEKIDCAV